MHWDVGYYGEVKDQDVYGSGTNIRRARLGFKGKADDFSFTATFDKGASAEAPLSKVAVKLKSSAFPLNPSLALLILVPEP